MKNFIKKILLVIVFFAFYERTIFAQIVVPLAPEISYSLNAGQSKTFVDPVSITLKPTVHIKSGATFHAYIGDVPNNSKPRVIVSTDIGGGDFDDHQSLIHFLLYANILNIRGFVSSPPFGDYSKFIEVWDAYGQDYDDLNGCGGGGYPTKQRLIDITRKGYVDASGNQLVRPPGLTYPQPADKQPLYPQASKWTDGSKLIANEAKLASNDDPLYILAWGGLADVAQALFSLNAEGTTEAINAISNIRLYSIGSWNTDNDKVSRDYVYNNYPDLWWIESNSTFAGMFNAKNPIPDSDPEYGRKGFVDNKIENHGWLGKLYFDKTSHPTMGGNLKEGDTPSFLYMISNLASKTTPKTGNLDNPTEDSWGGAYVKTNHGPNYWTDNQNPTLQGPTVNPDIEYWKIISYGSETVYDYRKPMLDDFAEKMACLPNNGRYGDKPTPQSIMKMIAYPNPSSGTVSIQSPIFKSKFNLRIVDKLNQNIHFKITERIGERIKIQIDGGEGEVYFIKVNTQGGAFVKKIFMKK